MNIFYISLGSFCHPKIILRSTNREFLESLPFDFNSSPDLKGIINILKELHENGSYEINLDKILEIYNENELCVKEKNMYLVHYFKTDDLIKNIDTFPVSANDFIKKDVIDDVKKKFKKRFERLISILNNPDNILCFLRIENYDNYDWKNELSELTKILSLFKNPNKYLIYTQNMIDEELDFNNSNVLNYQYNFPILFYKYYYYDMEIINNKDNFIKIFENFEKIINSENVINIKNNFIEKYYLNKDCQKILKLTNINYYTQYFIENDYLFLNNVITGYDSYKKINNIFEKI